jgi:hypothetical protein
METVGRTGATAPWARMAVIALGQALRWFRGTLPCLANRRRRLGLGLEGDGYGVKIQSKVGEPVFGAPRERSNGVYDVNAFRRSMLTRTSFASARRLLRVGSICQKPMALGGLVGRVIRSARSRPLIVFSGTRGEPTAPIQDLPRPAPCRWGRGDRPSDRGGSPQAPRPPGAHGVRPGQANAHPLPGCRCQHPRVAQKTGPDDRLGREGEDNCCSVDEPTASYNKQTLGFPTWMFKEC